MRRVLAIAVGLATLPVARAGAQVFVGSHSTGDSAVGLVPNVATTIPVFIDPNGQNFIRARMTFRYDPTRLTIEGVEIQNFVALWQNVDTVRGPGTFTVGAGSSFFISAFDPFRVFGLRVRLAAGATDGTFLHAEWDSLQTQFSGEQGMASFSEVTQLCHATEQYGDVDGSGEVDSRDALITLSASIGLPAAGFNLAVGDVDRDTRTNSRDALLMLAHSINVSIGIPHRTGMGVPDACPALSPLTDRIVYVRRNGVDSLFTLAAGSTTPAYVPNSSNNQSGYPRAPRLSSGNVIAYTCALPTNVYLCRLSVDGVGLDSIVPSIYSTPDWSPGDSLILFESAGGALFTVQPFGGGQIQRTPALPFNTSPAQGFAFNRTGTQIAYPSASSAARMIGLDGQGDVAITSDVPRSDIVRWNPAGDSLAIAVGNRGGFWLFPAIGGTARRVSSFRVYTTSFEAIDWGNDGLLFALDQPGVHGIWLLPADGSPLRRITNGPDRAPAFRRNP